MIVAETLYIDKNGYLSAKPGAAKKHKAVLKLHKEINEEEFNKLATLYKMRNFDFEYACGQLLNIDKLLEMHDIMVCMRKIEGRLNYEYVKTYTHDAFETFAFKNTQTVKALGVYWYTVEGIDVSNPNHEKALEKRKETIKVNYKIKDQIDFIKEANKDYVYLDKKKVLQIVNRVLIKKGFKPFKRSIRVMVS